MDRRHGMVVLELLVAITIAALLGLVGMRMMFAAMEQGQRQFLAESERIFVRLLESRLQRAFHQRAAHIFVSGNWLELRGLKIEEGLQLKSLRMRTHAERGATRVLKLEEADGGWLLAMESEFEGDGSGEVTRLDYRGRILVITPATKWSGGSCPEVLVFRFPDALSREAQEGFAIRDLW